MPCHQHFPETDPVSGSVSVSFPQRHLLHDSVHRANLASVRGDRQNRVRQLSQNQDVAARNFFEKGGASSAI